MWIQHGPWIHLSKHGPVESITGKYLFFSASQNALKILAEQEFSEHGFFRAKISSTGNDFVLCLYWFNDSRKSELANRHKGTKGIKYRYWKSDEDTRKGNYSEQHKQNLQRHLEEEYEDSVNDEDRPY